MTNIVSNHSFSDDDDGDVISEEEDRKENLFSVKYWPVKAPVGCTLKSKSEGFKEAVVKLEKLFEKGKRFVLGNIKVSTLDKRINQYDTEVEIDVATKDSKGVVTLKLFPGGKKRECTVMINKTKNHDGKFVHIISEQVVIPQLIGHLKHETYAEVVKRYFKCNQCEKTFRSTVERKNHEVKEHKQVSFCMNKVSTTLSKTKKKTVAKVTKEKTLISDKTKEEESEEVPMEVENNSEVNENSTKDNLAATQNLRDIPYEYKDKFSEEGLDIANFSIYSVSGGGLCGPNAIAAKVFGSEHRGVEVRKEINSYNLENWQRIRSFYSFPSSEKVGNKTISFQTETEYLNFLKSDDRSIYLWATHNDLISASDIYELSIKILSVNIKSAKSTNADARWTTIKPNKSSTEHKMGNTLYLYHIDDCHFDLILEKENANKIILPKASDSMPVDNESFSNKLENMKEKLEKEIETLKKELKTKQENIENLEAKLSKCSCTDQIVKETLLISDSSESSSDTFVETRPKKMKKRKKSKAKEHEKEKENEVEMLTEEDVKEKNRPINVVDMLAGIEKSGDEYTCKMCNKQFETMDEVELHMRNHREDGDWLCNHCAFQTNNRVTFNTHIETTHGGYSEEYDVTYACKDCGKEFSSNDEYDLHAGNCLSQAKYSDEDLSCKECDFQTTNRETFTIHIRNSHTGSQGDKMTLNCRFCGEAFKNKLAMNIHRSEKHKSFKPCTNFQMNKCKFNEKCFYQHLVLSDKQCICYICGEIFDDRDSLMYHRKSKHETKTCPSFLKNECQFDENVCWWTHTKNNQKYNQNYFSSNKILSMDQEKPRTETQDFRMIPVNLAPPSEMLTSIMTQMSQMKKQMDIFQTSLVQLGVKF